MPAYDYMCPNCHLTIEVTIVRERLNQIVVKCLKCDRVMSRKPMLVNAHYHGDGFYQTDGRVDLEKFGKERNGDN